MPRIKQYEAAQALQSTDWFIVQQESGTRKISPEVMGINGTPPVDAVPEIQSFNVILAKSNQAVYPFENGSTQTISLSISDDVLAYMIVIDTATVYFDSSDGFDNTKSGSVGDIEISNRTASSFDIGFTGDAVRVRVQGRIFGWKNYTQPNQA